MPLITELFAFIATEKPGEEGITAVQRGSMLMPLIGADATRVDSLRAHAQVVANTSGMHFTLARFSVREDLEVITPQGGKA